MVRRILMMAVLGLSTAACFEPNVSQKVIDDGGDDTEGGPSSDSASADESDTDGDASDDSDGKPSDDSDGDPSADTDADTDADPTDDTDGDPTDDDSGGGCEPGVFGVSVWGEACWQ